MKPIITTEEVISKIKDGMVLMIGGFMAGGSPLTILEALSKSNIKDLTVICNDTSTPVKGIGLLIKNKQVKKLITSHIGTNPLTVEQYNNKEIEIEFVPQGTLIERVRAGGSGLGGVLTPTGIGTIVENGKQKVNVAGKDFLLETPLKSDIALVGASIGDKSGNLFYKGTTQNFNPIIATAADIVIAEVNELVEVGQIQPECVHTPGIFVDYLVLKN